MRTELVRPRPSPEVDLSGLDDVLRSFPELVDQLKDSYAELARHAGRVERELSLTNAALEGKVRELDALKRHLEAVLDSLPTGVVVRNAEGRIVRVNDALLTILGTSADELLERHEHPGLAGAAECGETREVKLGAKRLVLNSKFSPVRLADGTLDGSVEIVEDRTESTALSERLHATDKLAALGTMATGIAHEIRNPMNAVKGFAALLAKHPQSDARTQNWAAKIVSGSDEADAIIENMLSFGSPERIRRETIDGLELLRRAAAAAQREKESGSSALGSVSVASDVPPFIGDAIKLRQAVRNLIANALEAQQNQGTVAVRLTLEREQIVCRVHDAGPGVPEEIRHRVLDTFFTTRAEGTGLGLALVSMIAQLHGGSVEVSPEPSFLGGAEILIRIPFQPAAALKHTTPQDAQRP